MRTERPTATDLDRGTRTRAARDLKLAADDGSDGAGGAAEIASSSRQ
jgi:hypothetical protein